MNPFLALLILFVICGPAQAREELRVEGIMYELQKPDDSIAVINGTSVRKGDLYQEYQVTEIGRDSIVLTSQKNGEQKRIPITGGAPQPEQEKSSNPPKNETSGETAKTPSLLDGIFSKASNMGGVLNLAWETKAMADARRIYSMAAAYQSQEESASSISIQDLVKHEMLPPDYQNGESGKYRFSIHSSAGGIEVYGEPIHSSSGLKYMCVDKWGTLRSSKEKLTNCGKTEGQAKEPLEV